MTTYTPIQFSDIKTLEDHGQTAAMLGEAIKDNAQLSDLLISIFITHLYDGTCDNPLWALEKLIDITSHAIEAEVGT